MIILGIDPGIARTGWCVIKIAHDSARSRPRPECLDIGVIETSAASSLGERLSAISSEIEKKITLWQPSAMAIEELFFLKRSPSVLRVAEARGAIVAVAAGRGVEVSEYNPVSVKKTITGYGSASKRQMQVMIKTILNLDKPPSPDDAADAAAIALCHYFIRGRYR
ncbi:MAG: crossover junction endodeoxyribonuclease RuvC [Endomicrobiia bacterium]|nr:crossover junction endodeoxyribonuclease RuvC [Endomicrobiia bacterium]